MKPTTLILVLLLTIASIITTGCASLTSGSNQTVTIDSNVQGADVYINGNPTGKTPFTGVIKKGGKTEVLLKKAGYKDTSMVLDTEIEGIFWGNIVVGGVLGSTTDAATGAMYKYAPASVTINMEKGTGTTVLKSEKQKAAEEKAAGAAKKGN